LAACRENYSDCSDQDPVNCGSFFLWEGEFCGRYCLNANGRDRGFSSHLMPLEVRISNVEKSHAHRVFESRRYKNTYTALGVTIWVTEDDSKALTWIKLASIYKSSDYV